MNNIVSICLISFFISSAAFPQELWEVIKTPVDVDLRRVFYLDSLTIWAAGDSGTIIHSSDKGETWQIQNSGLEFGIHDIFFLNDSLGWTVTWRTDGIDYQSEILNTTDGGITWISTDYRHLNIQLNTIFFIDTLNGWIGGEPFDFSFTTNGGVDWNPANIQTGTGANFPVQEIKFASDSLGFAVGGINDAFGVIWSTTNGGALWIPKAICPDRFLDFAFIDTSRAVALTNEIEGIYPMGVLNFETYSSTYTYFDSEIYAIVSGVDNRTLGEIWGTLSSSSTNFILSNDSTNSWIFLPTPDSLKMHHIAFVDSTHGIAVGEQGYILRYIPQKPVSVEENPLTETPNEFSLEQNYPNPFNPYTKIKYTVPFNVYGQLSKVSLIVYDILGNEIVTIVDEEQASGIYEVDFSFKSVFASGRNIANLPSGVYFYCLQIGTFTSTKKMVYLK